MNKYLREWNVIIYSHESAENKLKHLLDFISTFDCFLSIRNDFFAVEWCYTDFFRSASIIKMPNDKSKNSSNRDLNLQRVLENFDGQQEFVEEAFRFLNGVLGVHERKYLYKRYVEYKSVQMIEQELCINKCLSIRISKSINKKFIKYF